MTKQQQNNILDKLKIWAFPFAVTLNVFFLNMVMNRFESLEKKVEQMMPAHEKIIYNTEKIEKIDRRVGKIEDKVYNKKTNENE